MRTVAVIDIGTLKTKFAIARYDDDFNREILYKDKKLTVIGRDLDKTDNTIIQKSIDKQSEALAEFMEKIKEHNVDTYRVVGTEALRRAKNAAEVRGIIEAIVKVPVEILSHEQEAQIYFNAVTSDLKGNVAVIDVGGGSVQLTIGNTKNIDDTHLLKTGTYYLQEQFGKSHLPSAEDQKAAWSYVRSEVGKLGLTPNSKLTVVYGSTCIIDFFSETGVAMHDSGHSKTHPYKTKLDSMMQLYDKLMPLTYEQRMELFPSEPYFMWGADKAIMNIVALCEKLGAEEVLPSNMNISDGLLLELAQR
jgi:exopolyphosphatase/guanosine-5'-triphosphate,3'-diphosphate pyrophosphatase